MAYTPELSQAESGALRRLAWAVGKPMTKTMGEVLNHTCQKIDATKVCAACKDKTYCKNCFWQSKSFTL